MEDHSDEKIEALCKAYQVFFQPQLCEVMLELNFALQAISLVLSASDVIKA